MWPKKKKPAYRISLDKYSPNSERLYVSFYRVERRTKRTIKKIFFARGYFNFVKECLYLTTWWRGDDDDLNGMFKLIQERDWDSKIVYENDCEILTKVN